MDNLQSIDRSLLDRFQLAKSSYRFGAPQQADTLTVLPLLGEDRYPEIAPPLSGLKVSKVAGYGNLELANLGENLAIVPLHLGYIQDGAQNHALCRSAFIAAGQTLMFKDACCVQASQGGYLQDRQQWFFILPLQLRAEALSLQGREGYSKLWEAISRLNQQLNLPNIGHLEQIVSRKRGFLTQYQSRLELLERQTGALFFLQDKLVGIEIAPSAAYFREIWMPLVCFCYGVAAMSFLKDKIEDSAAPAPFAADNLQQLRELLRQSRQDKQRQIREALERTPLEKWHWEDRENFLDFSLKNFVGNNFAGQLVEEKGKLVYASIFAKPEYFSQET